MTLENKAEEYAYNQKTMFENECGFVIAEKSYIDGYRECEKEHKWHYVKNVDLPKKECNVLMYADYGNSREIGFSFWDGAKFKMYTDAKVIAWQELPTPPNVEEEENALCN